MIKSITYLLLIYLIISGCGQANVESKEEIDPNPETIFGARLGLNYDEQISVVKNSKVLIVDPISNQFCFKVATTKDNNTIVGFPMFYYQMNKKGEKVLASIVVEYSIWENAFAIEYGDSFERSRYKCGVCWLPIKDSDQLLDLFKDKYGKEYRFTNSYISEIECGGKRNILTVDPTRFRIGNLEILIEFLYDPLSENPNPNLSLNDRIVRTTYRYIPDIANELFESNNSNPAL